MISLGLREAKAQLSNLVDQAIKGEFVTITRHGKPAAVLVSVEAAMRAIQSSRPKRMSLVDYLKTFPGSEITRNAKPSRAVKL